MKRTKTYGKCPENPVNLNSVSASVIFLNNLVTEKGYHLVYHRKGTIAGPDHKLVDHYEIMTSENIYDDIYINIYHERSKWIPPHGYLFEEMSVGMNFQLMEHADVDQLDEEDTIEFDDQYLFTEAMQYFGEEASLIRNLESMPMLERVFFNSFGTNLYVEDFPTPLLLEYLKDQGVPDGKINKIILAIIPR